jgi:hypothetical protein
MAFWFTDPNHFPIREKLQPQTEWYHSYLALLVLGYLEVATVQPRKNVIITLKI